MKPARNIPLALFVACVVAATPFSWGAGRDAAAAGESQRKPGRSYPEMIEVFQFLPFAAGMVRIPLPKLRIGDDLPIDNARMTPGSSSLSSRTKVVRLIAPADPNETVTEYFGTSSW
jgi:hypothetical protein